MLSSALVKIVGKEGSLEPSVVTRRYSELFMDRETKILYYVTTTTLDRSPISSMCPYIGKHGKYCTIKDGNIVEID